MPVKLTKRNIEILDLLADGLTADQIGTKLGVSPNTIKAHVRLLKAKFGIHHGNTTRLVTLYLTRYPLSDRVWMLVAKDAKAGAVWDATAVLLAHLTNNGVSIEDIAVLMNRSNNFVQKLVDYGQTSKCTRHCSFKTGMTDQAV